MKVITVACSLLQFGAESILGAVSLINVPSINAIYFF